MTQISSEAATAATETKSAAKPRSGAASNTAALISQQFDRQSRALTEAGELLQKNAKAAWVVGGVATRGAQAFVAQSTADTSKLIDVTAAGMESVLSAKTADQMIASQQSLFSAYTDLVAKNTTAIGEIATKTGRELLAHWSDQVLSISEQLKKATPQPA